jgi:hypothetical protein
MVNLAFELRSLSWARAWALHAAAAQHVRAASLAGELALLPEQVSPEGAEPVWPGRADSVEGPARLAEALRLELAAVLRLADSPVAGVAPPVLAWPGERACRELVCWEEADSADEPALLAPGLAEVLRLAYSAQSGIVPQVALAWIERAVGLAWIEQPEAPVWLQEPVA